VTSALEEKLLSHVVRHIVADERSTLRDGDTEPRADQRIDFVVEAIPKVVETLQHTPGSEFEPTCYPLDKVIGVKLSYAIGDA